MDKEEYYRTVDEDGYEVTKNGSMWLEDEYGHSILIK